MPIKILMPALSPTMEEGTLAKWLVREGDKITSGEVIAEIETDKATMEFEAADEGIIGRLVIPEGTAGVKVNDLIAVLLEDGETADVLDAPAVNTTVETPPPLPGAAASSPVLGSPTASAQERGRIFASPLARRIAAERRVDLRLIKGSGPNGRIVKDDLRAASAGTVGASPLPAEAPRVAGSAPVASDGDAIKKLYADRPYVELKLDGMRRTIAARLTEAKQKTPHFYLRRDVVLDPLLAFRSQLNQELAPRDAGLSVNDFVIKASAHALRQVPDCNAVWAGDRILRFSQSDIAVAVAVEGGLFTPVIRDADRKTITTLSAEMKDLASRARGRKLAPHEYQGGSLAISNLGMMGVESFDAIISPPHSAILAVGAGVRRPIVTSGDQIEAATVMSLTLSVDHRVIDGALGAAFLAAVKEGLEHPITMLA